MNDKTAPEADVVLETRVSLLRNFADVPFDASMSDEEAMHNVARVNAALEAARAHGDDRRAAVEDLKLEALAGVLARLDARKEA